VFICKDRQIFKFGSVFIRKISVFLHATFHTQDRCVQPNNHQKRIFEKAPHLSDFPAVAPWRAFVTRA